MMKNTNIKPLGTGKSILFTLIPAALLFVTHYFLIPGYVASRGQPYFRGYWIGYAATMAMFLVAAMLGYLREGRPLTWQALKERFRLKPMNKGDWLWTAVIIVVVLATYFGLSFSGKWVNAVPFLGQNQVWPAEWGPQGASKVIPGQFMNQPLKGQWWVLGVYVLGWLFNIVGEEFWFRGYLLPRHEQAFGRSAWLVNALMFWFNHIYQPWILIQILPAVLLQVYVVQARQNTWIAIIQHGFVNGTAIFFLLSGVLG